MAGRICQCLRMLVCLGSGVITGLPNAIVAVCDVGWVLNPKLGRIGRKNRLVGEVADLWFHSIVMLSHLDISIDDVTRCLEERFGVSGHEEKASRGKSAN